MDWTWILSRVFYANEHGILNVEKKIKPVELCELAATDVV